MIQPSLEQQTVIDHIKNNKNVVVDAVAGSGKSTTILFLAKQLPDKKIVQITYNSALKTEVRQKVKEENIHNVVVHTFHSLAVCYYMHNAYTDNELRNVVASTEDFEKNIPLFDIVVLDEVQDMTPLYYSFVKKFIGDMLREQSSASFQLLILGDYMQGLYEFKGSDVRFLTFAHILWTNFPQLKNREFIQCSLKMSYRITRSMARFVNEVMLGENRLLACKDGHSVVYIRESNDKLYAKLMHMVLSLLNIGHKPDDFFFLGPSMKSVIKRIENVLVERKIPCYVPSFDKEKIDDRVIDGKVVFSTFHSVKGRQRKFVFVTGFDSDYFKYYGKELDKKKCPNTLYVGCTRATEKMIVIEDDGHNEKKPLEFLKMNHIDMKRQPFIEFMGAGLAFIPEKSVSNKEKEKEEKEKNTRMVKPTELIKFIDDSTLEKLVLSIHQMFTKISGDTEPLNIPVIISTKSGFHEDVSDLNGIAIPCIYTDRIQTTNILYRLIDSSLKELREGKHKFLKDLFKSASMEMKGVEDYLFLANIYSSIQEQLYFKLGQIGRDEYTWLDKNMIDICMERLDNVIRMDKYEPEVEFVIINEKMDEEHILIQEELNPFFPKDKFLFHARIDMVCDDVWELKCTSQISVENFLQTVIYAWLWRVIYPNDKREFKIFNIRTGEIYWLEKSSLKDLTPLMVLMLKSKYETPKKKTDDEFLRQFEC